MFDGVRNVVTDKELPVSSPDCLKDASASPHHSSAVDMDTGNFTESLAVSNGSIQHALSKFTMRPLICSGLHADTVQ